MLRTKAVYIKKIEVVAFRQKLPAGGFGIVIVQPSGGLNDFAFIDRKTGKAAIDNKEPKIFSENVWFQAMQSTKNLRYYTLPSINKQKLILDSNSYEVVNSSMKGLTESSAALFDNFVSKFINKKGEFLYQEMTLNLLQTATRSRIVSNMICSGVDDVDKIVRYIVKSKAESLANIFLPDDEHINALIEILNELCNSHAFDSLIGLIQVKTYAAINKVYS